MSEPFTYCPACGSPGIQIHQHNKLNCASCGFELFLNTASAVGVFICAEDKVLVVTRAQQPGLGLLDVPGGFVDPGESIEQAAWRELQEEIGLHGQPKMAYLGSYPNTYPYKQVLYNTCDVFMLMSLPTRPQLKIAEDEISQYQWLPVQDLGADDFAFASTKKVIEKLKSSIR